ncbi:hypothetical protein A3H03_00360 [Candidatus Kuenenbacteria bacterium RIFCSPLOWO2_12_FULL_42_13]|uniref:Transcription regulator TrmB N-terminal domain-containing protein n=3 Tax=Candidatus Kueneniibacteriota TaxID=1752740 RepID=A0A1F6G0D3_9BACT|nr:MAG: hypothetical protein A3H55_00020 [Candidatus Kuenenbacteria bacterium RIFCSPLOWO2_02_FULL_42_16]OGG91582.1 MAG: hypothetical protein A3H03_00360 [Candidatus Kuenenbacteria bacterium RIFCSPLOWO2_12_FULL_42_13]OGG98688.1 MAG: hypothetical protein A3E04_04025 [Candidatus Kuenenbacteria bacterium RIFCSPHIGHO2_12_FULL_42_14]
MYEEVFQEVGLTPNEAKAYEALLGANELNISSITAATGIHRRNVYDVLSRLSEKGLVFPIFSKGENIFKAVSPGKLLELLHARENKLEAIMPVLESEYQKTPRPQETFIYRGLAGLKNYFKDILKTGADLYSLGSVNLLASDKLDAFWQIFLAEATSLGIKEKYIFPAIVRERIESAPKRGNMVYKFLPPDKIMNLNLDIFGNQTANIIFGEKDDLTIYLTIDDALAQNYRELFDFFWNSLA